MMFRDRILEWTHMLGLLEKPRSKMTSFATQNIATHAISSEKEKSIDQERAEFYLNVSRAYIKVSQLAK